MNKTEEHILVRIGKERFERPAENAVHLVEDPKANAFLNDLDNYPHAFVLACCMDRQTKAERAWMIPVRIRDIYGSFEMKDLLSKTIDDYKKVFSENNLHRFNDTMAEVFYDAIQTIHLNYNDNAAEIWKGNPSSASVVYRFLQFKGVGIKIATMAANILARQFKIRFSDYYSIDVSPDTHVRRVMLRMGLVEKGATSEKIVYKAREMNPEFPGIIDYSLWEIGRTWCKKRISKINCDTCIVAEECPKNTL